MEPGAGQEGRWMRGLVRLQACARGFLLRRQLRAVRAEYEAVVLEVEGGLERLRWRGQHLLRPLFLEAGEEGAAAPGEEGAAAVPTHRVAEQELLEVEPAAAAETAPGEKSHTDKAQQETPLPEASALEREQGCGGNAKAAAELRSHEAAREGEGDGAGPDAGPGADKPSAEDRGAAAERGQCRSGSREPCAWDGAVLGRAAPGASLEISLEDFRDLPRTVPGLLAYRNHLVMELLWLQQAIVSRKNYLRLKKKLGAADL